MLLASLAALVGTGGAVLSWHRRTRRKAMCRSVHAAIRCSDEAASIFDIFWDLGASEFALEVMAHSQLLLNDTKQAPSMASRLAERIAEYGDYPTLIRTNLEAIQEVYQGHCQVGDRRRTLTLAAPETKTLALRPEFSQDSSANLVPYAKTTTPDDAELQQRATARSQDYQGPLQPDDDETIDIDQALKTDPLRLLEGLFQGQTGEIKRWFSLRTARKSRAELDTALSDLYRVYAKEVRDNPDFLAHLHDCAQPWKLESQRIFKLVHEPTWSHQPWSLCAQVLVQEAQALADHLALQVSQSVDHCFEAIDTFVEQNDLAMAGYLIYRNRYAIFAGKLALCDKSVRTIEHALYRLQHQIRECG